MSWLSIYIKEEDTHLHITIYKFVGNFTHDIDISWTESTNTTDIFRCIISVWIILRKNNINRFIDILALAFKHKTKKCRNVPH